MVRITVSYIKKRGFQNSIKNGKDQKEHLRKLTHLYLNDQYVDSIGDISPCQNLKVLFLQNNLLEKIENLDFALNLTHLYLQRNKLRKMDGFEGLISLQKLYLGYNSISVVEGLENSNFLHELHIENQKLYPGEEIIFDPRTIAVLGQTLKLMNLQGNNLSSLEDLVGLEKLKILIVANNNLNDINKIQAFLTTVPSLQELDMRNNPVIQDYKNCNRILASVYNLRVFNERCISATTLDFMKKFEEHQQKTTVRKPLHGSSDIIKSISELAYNLPEGLAKDVTSSIFKNVGLSSSDVKCGQMDTPQEQTLCTTSDGPFFHFPAFKSSTCLQYEGHTIPKPFRRKILLDGQLGQKYRVGLPVKFQAHWPASLPVATDEVKPNTESKGNSKFS